MMEDDQTIQAGGFMHQLSGDDRRLKLISFPDNFVASAVGSFTATNLSSSAARCSSSSVGSPNRLILEGVAFCERLIAVTTPLLLSSPVVIDARKFLKIGV
jgi:hypothetical protein